MFVSSSGAAAVRARERAIAFILPHDSNPLRKRMTAVLHAHTPVRSGTRMPVVKLCILRAKPVSSGRGSYHVDGVVVAEQYDVDEGRARQEVPAPAYRVRLKAQTTASRALLVSEARGRT